MAANASVTAAAILKSQYTQDKVYWIALQKNKAIAKIRKDEKFVGDYKYCAVQIETPQGGGVTIQLAQAHLAPGVYKRFQLTRKLDFSLARVTGEAMKAAEGDDATLVQLWTREMDGAIHTIKRSWAVQFWRGGTGTRGIINSGVTGNNVTLSLTTDIQGFSIGMTLQLAGTDGGTLRNAGANVVVTKIDRLNGILYFADILTNYIAAAANGDFILREGDLNAVILGANAWVPSANVTSTLFNNLDRTSDPVRLAGQFKNSSGLTIRDSIIEDMARIDVEGGEADVVALHPRDRATLTKELDSKSIYFKEVTGSVKVGDAEIGYDAIEADFDGQRVEVMSDINVRRQESWVTQWDTWGLNTLGPFPHIVDYDSLEFQRVFNDDSFEVRVTSKGDMENLAPAYTVHSVGIGT
jgi:hypothetical protein